MTERSVPDKFLVAFSFAGEQRELVRSIAEEVEKRFEPGKVFLDEWYEHYIAGDSADLTLQDIYHNRSELVVFCISKPYGNKPWTRVEFEAIRALKMQLSLSTAKSDRHRILPLRIGDGDVEGIFVNTICPDAREKPVAQTAELITTACGLSGLIWSPARQAVEHRAAGIASISRNARRTWKTSTSGSRRFWTNSDTKCCRPWSIQQSIIQSYLSGT